MSVLSERAKRQIALLAGGDLEGEEALEIRHNIETDPEHRQQWIRFCGCIDVLERSAFLATPPDGPSLWPKIEAQLKPVQAQRPHKFNGWVPALSLAAACIAMLIAGQMEGAATFDPGAPVLQGSFFPGDRLHRPIPDFSRSHLISGTVIRTDSAGYQWAPMPEISKVVNSHQWYRGDNGR